MSEWLNPVSDAELIATLWPDAPSSEDALQKLIDAAERQCKEYAPVLTEGAEVPGEYVMAVLYQARALHRASVAGGQDQVGSDFPVTVFPMDWTVKALLRPAKGVPGVF